MGSAQLLTQDWASSRKGSLQHEKFFKQPVLLILILVRLTSRQMFLPVVLPSILLATSLGDTSQHKVAEMPGQSWRNVLPLKRSFLLHKSNEGRQRRNFLRFGKRNGGEWTSGALGVEEEGIQLKKRMKNFIRFGKKKRSELSNYQFPLQFNPEVNPPEDKNAQGRGKSHIFGSSRHLFV